MTVKEMIKILKGMNQSAHVQLCDLSTDDRYDATYILTPRSIEEGIGENMDDEQHPIVMITYTDHERGPM